MSNNRDHNSKICYCSIIPKCIVAENYLYKGYFRNNHKLHFSRGREGRLYVPPFDQQPRGEPKIGQNCNPKWGYISLAKMWHKLVLVCMQYIHIYIYTHIYVWAKSGCLRQSMSTCHSGMWNMCSTPFIGVRYGWFPSSSLVKTLHLSYLL